MLEFSIKVTLNSLQVDLRAQTDQSVNAVLTCPFKKEVSGNGNP